MFVTVGICTWNRAELLNQTLAQMQQLEIPAGVQWEVLVVNNRSTDHTEEVLNRYASSLPLVAVYEERQGKSYALNTATARARGELILWTDDDVLVDRLWLAETVAAARRRPDYAFFGGPIKPWFTRPAPKWLTDNWHFVASAYAARDMGDEEFDFSQHRLPFGANLTIRTEAQRQHLYNPRFGRVGASEVRGEETQVLWEMLEAGLKGLWTPKATVQHYIPPERISMEYLIRFFHGIGQTTFYHDMVDGKPNWKRQNRKLRRRAMKRQASSVIGRILRPWKGNRWVEVRLQAAKDWGYFEASQQQRRTNPPQRKAA